MHGNEKEELKSILKSSCMVCQEDLAMLLNQCTTQEMMSEARTKKE